MQRTCDKGLCLIERETINVVFHLPQKWELRDGNDAEPELNTQAFHFLPYLLTDHVYMLSDTGWTVIVTDLMRRKQTNKQFITGAVTTSYERVG